MPKANESTAVAGGNHSARRLKPHHTRTRHGCERCRAHRRKCDEGKPRCKRCANASAVCKYVTHVSFKDKNSQTLPNDLGRNLVGASNSPGKYHNIKFVLDNGPVETRPSDHALDSTNSKHPDNQECTINAPESPFGLGLDEGWPLVGWSPLSNTEIGLLKYYTHRVAPWLDVYDQDQTFGHHVPRLSMTSPCVLEVLLQLAAVSSGRSAEIVTRRCAGVFHLQSMANPPGTESPSSALRVICCFALARTLFFVNRAPDMWERSFQGDGALFYFRRFHFPDTTQRRMWLGFLTLFVRLEIAYCLVNQTTPAWIPELASHIQTQSGANATSDDKSQEVLHASLQCLGLLLDTMKSCFRGPKLRNLSAMATRPRTPTTPDTCHARAWKELIERLHAWYKSRPSSLEPLIEVENTEDVFPIVMFSNGAGVSCNTLYHIAMFLLLSNKPRPEPADKQHTNSDIDSTQVSPNWHALRVCGIAVNSEYEHSNCWDPAMIASFALAARQMTHRSQQNEITTCLERLKSSGWRVDSLISKLHDESKSVG
ncbi:hypothetical protein GGR51DRAFT_546976 [Nemania sp. FL0031]|nr:hypothetical protein GGR51DRAFT_546976 [Nemania sp. FL0031]